MSDLVRYLRMFNRKERYHLIRWALGTFDLGADFRRVLSEKIGAVIPDTPDAYFAAMDYHLNWIYAALALARGGSLEDRHENPKVVINGKEKRIIQGNQEDVDLIVAFDEGAITHVILLEAKMDTGWSNKQLRHKAERLSLIFQDELGSVRPYFVLASPNRPKNLKTEGWPDWMRGTEILHLEIPIVEQLVDVTRVDAGGEYWITRAVRPSSSFPGRTP